MSCCFVAAGCAVTCSSGKQICFFFHRLFFLLDLVLILLCFCFIRKVVAVRCRKADTGRRRKGRRQGAANEGLESRNGLGAELGRPLRQQVGRPHFGKWVQGWVFAATGDRGTPLCNATASSGNYWASPASFYCPAATWLHHANCFAAAMTLSGDNSGLVW